MFKKLSFVIVSAFFMPWLTYGQFEISGTVKNLEGEKLPGAHVVLEGTYKKTVTDSDGMYRLTDVEGGKNTLKVSYVGYQTVVHTVDLNENAVVDFELYSSVTLAEEVIVSATRASDRTPATFTNVSGEFLKSHNLGQDFPLLIGTTPSVVTTSDAGAGVGYTGINIRGSDITRINVTINGIPVNDSESHGVWWVNMPDIAESIDNLQIQRGVGTSTHGAAAFGATMNLQTLTLNDEQYAEYSMSGGSFNTWKNTVSFGTGLLANNWSFDIRLSKINSDGYIDRANSDLKSFYFSGGYHSDKTLLRFVTFSGKEQTYQAWYGVPSDSLETNRTFNPAGMYVDHTGALSYYDNETDNYQQDHFQLHFSHQLDPALIFNTSLHYTYGRGYYEQFRQNERLSRYGLSDIEIGDTVISRTDLVRQRWLDNDFYGITWSLNYNGESDITADLGGGYNIYEGDHFGKIIWARYAKDKDVGQRYYDNLGVKKDFNVFGKVNYRVLPGLNVFADMQYRFISYNFEGPAWVLGEIEMLDRHEEFNFFNPKAGVIYDVSSQSNVYGFFGIGNREPVRRDFTESTPETRPKHETMLNYEVGYKLQSDDLMVGVNVYYMDYENQLVLTGEINDVGNYTRTNIDDSYRTGVELQAGYIFTQWLKWDANLTLSRNKIDEFTEHFDVYDDGGNWTGMDSRTYKNTDIAFSPSIIGSSILNVKPFRDTQVTLITKYVGDQYIDNTQSTDRMLEAYLVNDLRIGVKLNSQFFREIELVFLANNIFDVSYITDAWIYKGYVEGQGLMALSDGYFPQAGRNFMAGVNLRF